MKSPIISLRDVGFSYSIRKGLFHSTTYTALRAVSFDIHRGETIGLIGRNGCGKSTLLRLLAQISKPDQGSITFAKDITATLLTLQAGFDQELPGRDNVILSGMLLGMPYRVIRSRLDRIIEFAESGPFIDEPLKSYSDGMRARLGFALALELAPDVFLVDEVLGVGDAAFQRKARNAMRNKLTSDQTVVYVSHDLQSVVDLCNSVVWIDKGETRMIGKAGEVVEAYLKATCAQTPAPPDSPQAETPEAPLTERVKDHLSPREVGVVVSHGQGLPQTIRTLESLTRLPALRDMRALVVACHGPEQDAQAICKWAEANWIGGAGLLHAAAQRDEVCHSLSSEKCRCLVLNLGPGLTEVQTRNAVARILLQISGLSWVWFLSSGVIVVPGTPFALLQHMLARPMAVIGSSIGDADHPGRLKCAGGYALSRRNLNLEPLCAGLTREEAAKQSFHHLEGVYWGCMALPTELIQTNGFFDEELSRGYAALDYCTRAAQAGYALEWCRSALVMADSTPVAALRDAPEIGLERLLLEDLRSAMVYTGRHHPELRPWLVARRALCGSAMWALRGKWRLAKGCLEVLAQQLRPR